MAKSQRLRAEISELKTEKLKNCPRRKLDP